MNRYATLTLFLVWSIACAYCGSAETEDQSEAAPVIYEKAANPESFNAGLKFARRLMKRSDYFGAASLLETLYPTYPDNLSLYRLLKECYRKLDQHGKWEELTRRALERHPDNYSIRMDLGLVLIRQQRLDEGLEAYRKAVALARADAQYLAVIRSMMEVGLESEALAALDSLGESFRDKPAFALQRGKILAELKQYDHAAGQFFSVLDDTSGIGKEAEKRLLDLLGFEESSPDAEKVLLQMLATQANIRALKLLTHHYVRSGRLDRALEFAVLQDSLESTEGISLVFLMRTCRERKLFEEAARMGEYIIERYRKSPALAEAYFMYGEALTRLGRFDDAISVYDSIIARFPRLQEKGEALFHIGNIQLEYLCDYSAALTCFDSVLTYYPIGTGSLRSSLAIPHCYLRRGDLDEATDRFTQLAGKKWHEEVAEKIDFYLALLAFCRKDFDSSRVAFRRLMVDYPRGFYVNDAMQYLMVMDKAKGASDDLLGEYAEAVLFEQRRLPDSVAVALTAVADNKNKVLADAALFRLSQVSLERDDSLGTLEFVERLVSEFPESYYVPFGLKTKADLYLAWPGKLDEARAIYRQLLEEYADYPFSSEIRKKLRELEVDRSVG
ncbi:MAG: tetratricopeptide repeat protein [candidate division Zixibacteria bacterium]|nr:tetratricopeptide repeat protein [candidate division Zixibacteria bacterium]